MLLANGKSSRAGTVVRPPMPSIFSAELLTASAPSVLARCYCADEPTPLLDRDRKRYEYEQVSLSSSPLWVIGR